MVKASSKCVYKHIQDGEVFYVGMGNGSRPFSTQGRSDKWQAIAGLGDFECEIVAWFDNPEDALRLERELIHKFKPAGNIVGILRGAQTPKGDPLTERFEMRIDPELKAAAEAEATRRETTLAEMIRRYLRKVARRSANKNE